MHRGAVHRRSGPAGETEQVLAFVGVEAERPGQGGQHLRRGLRAAAAFQFDVVVHRRAGQLGDLVAAQSDHATARPGGEADFGRGYPGPPRLQEQSQFSEVHPTSLARSLLGCQGMTTPG